MQLSFSPVVSLVAALLASGCRSGEELEKNLVYKESPSLSGPAGKLWCKFYFCITVGMITVGVTTAGMITAGVITSGVIKFYF